MLNRYILTSTCYFCKKNGLVGRLGGPTSPENRIVSNGTNVLNYIC
ncbi:hypothetical protein G15_1030 [Enterococcus avium]|nr:hypothetical protein G15_1030 [Enterococcus avium]